MPLGAHSQEDEVKARLLFGDICRGFGINGGPHAHDLRLQPGCERCFRTEPELIDSNVSFAIR